MVTSDSSEANKGYFLLICEIGPIGDFTRNSRKMIDFWGASFFFSYVMAEIARKMTEAGASILLPYLTGNPMITGAGEVRFGNIPDQLYLLFDGTKRAGIKTILKEAPAKAIKKLIDEVAKSGILKTGESLNEDTIPDILKFFNFFYVLHGISAVTPTHEEFIDAERKIRMRAAMRPFNQLTDTASLKKWEKCNLCGDRKSVHEISTIEKHGNKYDTERMCGVCLLKRYLKNIIKEIVTNTVVPDYDSTSDIAAIPLKRHYSDLTKSESLTEESKKELETAYQTLTEAGEEAPVVKKEKDNGRLFFTAETPHLVPFRDAFKKCDKELKNIPFPWLERPFFAIVYLDGDNMGKVLKENAEKFPEFLTGVSSILSSFAGKRVPEIVNKYGGKIIYCAGDDITMVIHPEYLLNCIKELSTAYRDVFQQNSETKPFCKLFTLSAGAVVCYHKFPLSEAIRRAGSLLKNDAKKQPGKDATAIALIQGHTETVCLTIKNNHLDDIQAIRDCMKSCELSRTTPYRIRKEKDLLDVMMRRSPGTELPRNYLYALISGTRGITGKNARISEIVDHLLKFGDTETMISALLFARFLTGDK
jgi:hypothetical protein